MKNIKNLVEVDNLGELSIREFPRVIHLRVRGRQEEVFVRKVQVSKTIRSARKLKLKLAD